MLASTKWNISWQYFITDIDVNKRSIKKKNKKTLKNEKNVTKKYVCKRWIKNVDVFQPTNLPT